MTTSHAQLDAWRAARSEHQRLEFKDAKTQFDNCRLYKYCVALAKTASDKPEPKVCAVGFQGLDEYINGLVPSNEVIE